MAGKKQKKEKKKNKKRSRFRFALKLSLLLFLSSILLAVIVIYAKYGKKVMDMQAEARRYINESTVDTFRASETSTVYDVNGKLLSVLKGEKDVYYLDYADIPQYAKDALVSIEDKKFYSHRGFDIRASIRAVLALIKNDGDIKQGASTITQQLSRNIFLTHDVTWERKIREIFIATEMEKKYKKIQILEFYLNNIYFSNGYYGIEAASKGYFSRSSHELNLAEITFLCAIPNNPTLYDPVIKPENTKKRQKRILDQMLSDKKITQEEYDGAVNQEITLKMKKMKKQNYIQTYVNYCATRALMERNGFEFRYDFDSEEDREAYDEQYNELYSQCQKSLFHSGYHIYTSIDLSKQKKLQNSVNTALEGFKDKTEEGIYELQGAAVCIDNETGRVAAIVGGRAQNTDGYTLNRGYQTFRQPGSAIKPLLVYTPAFEKGHSPTEYMNDVAFKDGPKNSDGTYSGYITLRKAVEVSKNTIAWKLFEDLTPKVGMSYLLKMQFSKIVKEDYYPASSLGGFTYGASPVEMAAGYAALENDGVYRNPSCIVKIVDSRDIEIVRDEIDKKTVYKEHAARTMTDVLTGVIKYGTGRGLDLPGMSSAGKTGTTSEKKDGWFVGYTPYFTTAVWVGYDIPKPLSDLHGSTYPGTIWKNFMQEIHDGLKNIGFPSFVDPYKMQSTPEPEDTVEPEDTSEPEVTLKPDDNSGNDTIEEPITDPDEEDDSEEEKDDTITEEPNVTEEPDVPQETNNADADFFKDDTQFSSDPFTQ